MKRRTPFLALSLLSAMAGGLPIVTGDGGEDWPARDPAEPRPLTDLDRRRMAAAEEKRRLRAKKLTPTPEEDDRRLAELDAAAAGHRAACLCDPCAERWRVVARIQSRRS